MINKAKIRRIVCELKGKQVNWCMFAKWTIDDQLCRLQSLEAIHCNKPNVVLGSDKFENSKGEQEVDNLLDNNMGEKGR
jgi:hypothetical protein